MRAFTAARLRFLLVILASSGCAAAPRTQAATPRTQATAPVAALFVDAVPELQPGDLTKLMAMIKPHEGEVSFEQIPWLESLWEGRIRAASEGKPVVAFLMSGHPMGCT